MQTFLYTLHFIVCFVLIGVVLLQRGKGADLGASLGGGGANTLFGSRGAGNFLSRITTASAIIFMGTSLSLSYLGYQASDVKLFDESDGPMEIPGLPGTDSSSGTSTLEEIPSAGLGEAAGDMADKMMDEAGSLVEIGADSAAEAVQSAGETLEEAAGSAADALQQPADSVE